MFAGFDVFLDVRNRSNAFELAVSRSTSVCLCGGVDELVFLQGLLVREALVAYQALKRGMVFHFWIVGFLDVLKKSFASFELF